MRHLLAGLVALSACASAPAFPFRRDLGPVRLEVVEESRPPTSDRWVQLHVLPIATTDEALADLGIELPRPAPGSFSVTAVEPTKEDAIVRSLEEEGTPAPRSYPVITVRNLQQGMVLEEELVLSPEALDACVRLQLAHPTGGASSVTIPDGHAALVRTPRVIALVTARELRLD